MEVKATNINNRLQIIFNAHFEYSDYVGYILLANFNRISFTSLEVGLVVFVSCDINF